VRIHLLVEHALELEAAYVRLEGLRIRLDGARGSLVVLAFRQLQQLARIGDALAGAIDLLYGRGEACALATQLLCPLLIGPDRRILELAGDLLEPLLLLVVLKETPEGRRYAPRDP
jgi:hypothetical protein